MQAKSLKTEQKFNGQKINVKSTLTGSASFKSTTVFTLFFLSKFGMRIQCNIGIKHVYCVINF